MLEAMLLSAALAVGAVASPAPVHVQPLPTPQFRHYGVSDGLPSGNVYTIVQDTHGVLWMGTTNGLVRFDGKHFRVFRHDPRDSNSLPSNDVSAIMVDRRGRLWVGGGSTGLNLYRPVSGNFKSWLHRKGDPNSLASNDVNALVEGPDGSIWIALMNGLDRLYPDGRIEHFSHDPHNADSLASNINLSLRMGAHGSLWIGSYAGLDHRLADGRIEHVRFEGVKGPVQAWGVDGDPVRPRVDTNKGLFRVGKDGVARRVAPEVLPKRSVETSLRMPDGSLWVGTDDGLYWIGPRGRHRYLAPQPGSPEGSPGTVIWKLMRDHEGGLWVTTKDGGVGYLRPDWRQFTVFVHHPGDNNSLAMRRVSSQTRLDGHLLVGGPESHFDWLEPGSGAVKHLRLVQATGTVTALVDAGNGAVWVGYSGSLFLHQDGRMRKVASKQLRDGVNRLVTDAEGNAYATAPNGGVFGIDRGTLAVRALPTRHGTRADHDVKQLLMHDGVPWKSSSGGLARLDVASGQFVDVPGVARGRILNFAFDDDGLWLVRPDSLEHYRLENGRVQRDRMVGVAQGWPEIAVVAMFCDREGRVWLTSQTGLWRFDPANGTFHSYGVRDGLPSPQFSSLTVTRMPDGMVYTGTFNGIVGWNPEHMHEQPQPPRMLLTAVTVQRDGHTVRLAPDQGALHLRWNDRELHVAVQALSYLDPERNHYRFRMTSLDTGWVDTGSHGERDFTGLEHGDYRLQMEAAGPSGAWAALPPLSVRVDRPPWNTPWAWAAYVLLGGALVWLMLGRVKRRIEQRHRFQLAEQKRAMAEQASAAKSTFLATLSHEIRTPMTGVLGMAELLLRSPLQPRQREHAQTIRRSGTLLLRLVNEALDMARIEAGRLELDIARIDLRALLDDVVQLESGVARDKGLRLELDVAADIPACVRGDALRIQQVLLNLINNALKFTEHGGIGLTLARSEDGFEFSVRDTGPGIPEASRERLFQRYEQAESPQRSSGTGLGLAICKELVTLMDGRFWLKSSGPEGSIFAVWLPLPECEATDRTSAMAAADREPASRNVLLIEDNPTVAEVIRGLLENSGHTVRHVAHGLAGLAELESATFDVLLLDLDLPGVDGFEIARLLRQRESGDAHLPIIAITARSGGDEEQRARAAGMDDFLRKPLSGEQLEAAFGRILDQT